MLLGVINSLCAAILPVTVLTADKSHFKVCEEKCDCECYLHFCKEPARAPANIHSDKIIITIIIIIVVIIAIMTIIIIYRFPAQDELDMWRTSLANTLSKEDMQ